MSRLTPPKADALFTRIMSDIIGAAPKETMRQDRPGVSIQTLWDENSFLIRCTAGTAFPAHTHDRNERMFVLDGEIRFGAKHFLTGDFEVGQKNSDHEAGEAIKDCLLLIQYDD